MKIIFFCYLVTNLSSRTDVHFQLFKFCGSDAYIGSLSCQSQSSDYNMFNVISHISVSQGSRYSYVLWIAIICMTTATLILW